MNDEMYENKPFFTDETSLLDMKITDVFSIKPEEFENLRTDQTSQMKVEGDTFIDCVYCTFRSTTTTDVQVHLENDHICHICQKIFVLKEKLDKHIKEHENKDESKVACPYCAKVFRGNPTLFKHIDIAHSNLVDTETETAKISKKIIPLEEILNRFVPSGALKGEQSNKPSVERETRNMERSTAAPRSLLKVSQQPPCYNYYPSKMESKRLRKLFLDDQADVAKYFYVNANKSPSLLKISSAISSTKKLVLTKRKSKQLKRSKNALRSTNFKTLQMLQQSRTKERKLMTELWSTIKATEVKVYNKVPDLIKWLDQLLQDVESGESSTGSIVSCATEDAIKNEVTVAGKSEGNKCDDQTKVMNSGAVPVQLMQDSESGERSTGSMVSCATEDAMKNDATVNGKSEVKNCYDQSEGIKKGTVSEESPTRGESPLSINESKANDLIEGLPSDLVVTANRIHESTSDQFCIEATSQKKSAELNTEKSCTAQISPCLKRRRKSKPERYSKKKSRLIITESESEVTDSQLVKDEFLDLHLDSKFDGCTGGLESAPTKSSADNNSVDNLNLYASKIKVPKKHAKRKSLTDKVCKVKRKIYVDPKLSKIPDENPYSKKAQSFRKRENKDTPEILDLQNEVSINFKSSMFEPYCTVCEMLLDRAVDHSKSRTNVAGRIPKQSVVWVPQTVDLKSESPSENICRTFPVSRLLVCTNCKVCVHQACYNGETDDTENWTCDRCAALLDIPEKPVSCCLCHGSQGALKQSAEGGMFYHIRCAVLVPELATNPEFDLSLIPRRRWNVGCLLCGETGKEPAIHCMASKKCMLSFHLSCAFLNNVDCALGPDNKIILRCSFCVEQFSLKQDDSVTDRFCPQDIFIGEEVEILNHPGVKVGVVVSVDKEHLYSIAFDDGSFCDSVDPINVTFSDPELDVDKDMDRCVNAPVKVVWEGDECSGIFKKKNVLTWYKVKPRKKMACLELERSDLNKK